MGMATETILNFLGQSPRITCFLLGVGWLLWVCLGILTSAICFSFVFLPSDQHIPVSFWEIILVVAGLKLLSVGLAYLHQLRMRQWVFSDVGQALKHLYWALRLTPGDPDLYLAWGHLLYLQGDLQGARQRYQQVCRLFPLEPAAAIALGRLELSINHWEEAYRHFAHAYRLARGVAWNDVRELIPEAVNEVQPHKIRTSWSKLCFDEMQLDFLLSGHYLGPPFSTLRDQYRALMKELASQSHIPYPLWLNPQQHAQILAFWGRNVHIAPVPEFPSEVTQLNQADHLETEFQRSGIVIIDQLLTPEACEALLHFCQKSTIWHDDHKQGYLGSYMDDGFNCPLLFQIARELKYKLPSLLGAWSLLQMWAYNHDHEAEGIGLHADAAHINVNLWLTPDSANRIPNTGGLRIYPVEAPPDWDFLTLNTDSKQIQALLTEKQVEPVIIPYAQNRAVIFRSRYFHATDHVHFHPGYLNRRINVTFLFGRYQPELLI